MNQWQINMDKLKDEYENPVASEKQLAYIDALGGVPDKNLSMVEASALIDKLRNTASATSKQIKLLQKLGAEVPEGMTCTQASKFISEIQDNQPPTQQQIDFIKTVGGNVPKTKREASILCDSLRITAPVTSEQRKEAEKFGIQLNPSTTVEQADQLLGDAEMDADTETGKPPTKAQLTKIRKLGGDPEKAINTWRAENYIEELEDSKQENESRIEEALEWFFGDKDIRDSMPVKKPTKAIMQKALEYGEVQGWGKDWESNSDGKEYDLIPVSIYAVAPELLKKNAKPPQMPIPVKSNDNAPKGKGCLIPIALILGGCFVFLSLLVSILLN